MMNDVQRLKNMGISVWALRKPEHYPLHQQKIILPSTCRLLLVSDSIPDEADAWLFGKIIASMQVAPEEAMYLSPLAFSLIETHTLDWCWFAGCALQSIENVHVLTSLSLSHLQTDMRAKKDLWQQIKRAVTA